MGLSTQMQGKVVIVTGANSGIGKETALALAKKGANVVMVCRSPERGRAAQLDIIAESGNHNVDLLIADLSSQQSIRDLADEFRAKYDRLDVLVNNAGGMFSQRHLTVDGLEYTFALNHLAYFLLTNLLLDMLKASAPARIVNVASAAERSGKIDFDDLQSEHNYRETAAYSTSKLANLMFTYELARRLRRTGVTVNAVHPGVVRTNFLNDSSWYLRIAAKPLIWFGRSPKKGAETVVYLASSPHVERMNGLYFHDKEVIHSSEPSYSERIARRLWDESADLTRFSEFEEPLESVYLVI